MKPSNFALLAVASVLLPGCLIVDHEHPGCYGDSCGVAPGDFGFYWRFELAEGTTTDSCYDADVARVDTRIYDDYGDLEYAVLDRPCGDLGLELTNFRPGWYDMQLKALCPLGIVTHEGWYELWVDSGYNDFGDLVLDYLGPCE